MADPATAVRLCRSSDVASAEVQGEAVLLELRRGTYYSLNRTGTVVWELLAEPRTLAELHAALLARFEVEAAALHADLAELLADLRLHGLVEEQRAPGVGAVIEP